MQKRIYISGLVGATALLIWTFVLNGVFGFNARFAMNQVPNEREVYALLKSTITEPGRYLCNPELTADGRFPDNEPVFGVHYGGVGHEAAGLGVILGLFQFLIVPMIGTWMLSLTAERYRSRFHNRVLFFVAIGFVLAISGDLNSFGIGGSPLRIALIFAARTVVTWTIIGVAVAAVFRPLAEVERTV